MLLMGADPVGYGPVAAVAAAAGWDTGGQGQAGCPGCREGEF
jgi:hypothetical protein